MKLLDDWKIIFKKAWSIRLMILAGLLTGAEIVLPMFSHQIPQSMFATLSFACVSAALVARLVAQNAAKDT